MHPWNLSSGNRISHDLHALTSAVGKETVQNSCKQSNTVCRGIANLIVSSAIIALSCCLLLLVPLELTWLVVPKSSPSDNLTKIIGQYSYQQRNNQIGRLPVNSVEKGSCEINKLRITDTPSGNIKPDHMPIHFSEHRNTVYEGFWNLDLICHIEHKDPYTSWLPSILGIFSMANKNINLF